MKKRNLVSYIAILMAIGFIIAVVGIIIDGQVMQESYETMTAQSYNYFVCCRMVVWLFFSFHIGHSDLCHWILVVDGSAYAYG